MNAAHKPRELSTPSEELPKIDSTEDGEDAYGAPTRVGPMARETIEKMMADADAAAPASAPASPPPVSEIRALLVRAADPQTTGPAQPPAGPHVIPVLFDDSDDFDGDDGEPLDANALFGPRQSGATLLLDLSRVSSVIDGLEQGPADADRPVHVIHVAPYADANPLAAIELAASAHAIARRQAWTRPELAIMAISFLVVACPALYILFSTMF